MYTIPGSPLQIRACLVSQTLSTPLCTTVTVPHISGSNAPSITAPQQVTLNFEVISIHIKAVEILFTIQFANSNLVFVPSITWPQNGIVYPQNSSWMNPSRYSVSISCQTFGSNSIICYSLQYKVHA